MVQYTKMLEQAELSKAMPYIMEMLPNNDHIKEYFEAQEGSSFETLISKLAPQFSRQKMMTHQLDLFRDVFGLGTTD